MALIISTFLKCQWAGAERRPTGLSPPARPLNRIYNTGIRDKTAGTLFTKPELCLVLTVLLFDLFSVELWENQSRRSWKEVNQLQSCGKMKNILSSISQKHRPYWRRREGYILTQLSKNGHRFNDAFGMKPPECWELSGSSQWVT